MRISRRTSLKVLDTFPIDDATGMPYCFEGGPIFFEVAVAVLSSTTTLISTENLKAAWRAIQNRRRERARKASDSREKGGYL
jgi:hypothetical protein